MKLFFPLLFLITSCAKAPQRIIGSNSVTYNVSQVRNLTQARRSKALGLAREKCQNKSLKIIREAKLEASPRSRIITFKCL